MRKLGLALATLAWVPLVPGVALAWHEGRPHDARPHDSRPRENQPRPPVTARPFVFLRFGPPIVPSPPPVVYVQPAPVVYVVPPADPGPEPDLAPPPAPVEPPPEIVLPTGRWELHGDGVTWPHVWVWVPAHRPPRPAPRTEPPAPPSSPPG